MEKLLFSLVLIAIALIISAGWIVFITLANRYHPVKAYQRLDNMQKLVIWVCFASSALNIFLILLYRFKILI